MTYRVLWHHSEFRNEEIPKDGGQEIVEIMGNAAS